MNAVSRLLARAVVGGGLLLATAGATGCGGSDTCQGSACGGGGAGGAVAGPCATRFLGDYDDAQTTTMPCATLVAKANDWTLAVAVTSAKVGADTKISLDLGASPHVGSSTAATLARWSAISADSAGCVYEAGAEVVPPGSFTLTLTTVDTDAAVAHGALEVLQSVHAPPGKDCGNDDYERIDVAF